MVIRKKTFSIASLILLLSGPIMPNLTSFEWLGMRLGPDMKLPDATARAVTPFLGLASPTQFPDSAIPPEEREPNNRSGRANRIPEGTPFVRASIDPVGDVDFFSFTAHEGDYIFVSVDTSSSMTSQDSTLRLARRNQTIEFDNDDGPNPLASGIAAVRVLRTGTFTLEVQEGGNDETISAYRLFLCLLPGGVKAESEPNDVPSVASLASNLSTGIISAPDDLDIWQFPASEMDTLFLSLDQTVDEGGFDAVLELRDPSGALLAVQNNNGGEADDPEFLSLTGLPLTGVYTLYVRQEGVTDSSQVLDYRMGICLNGRPLRQPPVADAGRDQKVLEGTEVLLDGSASFDPEGESLMFEWAQLGEKSVFFDETDTTPTFETPDVPLAEVIDLSFELTVTSVFGLSDTAQVTVRVADRFQLKDDVQPDQVLLNLATLQYSWESSTGMTFSGPMTVDRDGDVMVFTSPGTETFVAKVGFDSRAAVARLDTGTQTLMIVDSNIDDSQDPF